MVTVAEARSKERGQVISRVRPYILPEMEKIRKESCQAMVPGGATLTFLKFMFAFPLAFHTANAIRRFLCDTGRFLKIKEVHSTERNQSLASYEYYDIVQHAVFNT
uniref:Uncharacterized protein n=1 Tax=Glossina austeni TaxID=7395 RepID=A0A1A9V1G5_GLOAU